MRKNYAIWKLRQGTGTDQSGIGLSSPGSSGAQTSAQNEPVRFFLEILSQLKLVDCPLKLLLTCPTKFIEINWPSLREWLHRLTYTLRFETPLRLRQDVKYEFIIPESEKPSNSILYVCSLSDYLPALEIRLNSEPQVVLRVDEAVSLILDRIWATNDIQLICDYLRQRYSSQEVKGLLRQAIRKIVNSDVPMFIRKDFHRQSGKASILSISSVGNPFEFRETGAFKKFNHSFLSDFGVKLPSSKEIKSVPPSRRILITAWRVVKTLLYFSPMDEPEIFWEIYPKEPSGSVWTYLFAPEKFHLSLEGAKASNSSVEILHVSSKDPDAVCLRIGPREMLRESWLARIKFKIRTPATHRLWLGGISFLLLLLGAVWLGSVVYSLGGLTSFGFLNQFGSKCRELTGSMEFFSATVTLISFLFVARGWLVYEETVFRLTSLRFSLQLVVIFICALIALFL